MSLFPWASQPAPRAGEIHGGCPGVQCPRHVQTGGQGALFQPTPAAGGNPHLCWNQPAPRLAALRAKERLRGQQSPRKPADSELAFCDRCRLIPTTSSVSFHTERTSRWGGSPAQTLSVARGPAALGSCVCVSARRWA